MSTGGGELGQQVRDGSGMGASGQPLAPLLPREASCCGSCRQKGRTFLCSGETPVWAVKDDWQGWESPLFPTLGKAAFCLVKVSGKGSQTQGSLAFWVHSEMSPAGPGRVTPRCAEDRFC